MKYDIADLELCFLVFCRVGSCLMLMPGFASTRVPMRVRLFLSLVVSLALIPMIPAASGQEPFQSQPSLMAIIVAREVFAGAFLGFIGRLMFSGLHFAANSAAMMIGLSSQATAVEDDQSTDAFAEMFTLTAAVTFFLLDLHIDVIIALSKTYDFLPIRTELDVEGAISLTIKTMNNGFLVALQVVAPFVAYSILANLVFAIINKLVPQFPAYFVSVPFILSGGLVLAYFIVPNGLDVFFNEFSRVLVKEMGG
jgi:flagellar biosynthesis protein FliR